MKNTLSISLLSILLFSCSKDYETGTVKDYGAQALDGCGWVIEIGSEVYSPTNLATQYQQDGLSIELEYKELNSMYTCGLLPTSYPEIEIKDVK